MTIREILIAFVSSLFGGLVVLLVEQFLTVRRDKRKQLELEQVRLPNRNKVITDDIFWDLSPGTSMSLAKEVLGSPAHYSRRDFGIFSEEEVTTHSYIYSFKNAYVKITSRDNEMIDTLTVLPDDSLSVEHLLFPCDQPSYKFNEVVVCPELLERSEHTYISSMRDNSFAVRYHLGPPHDLSTTYFGHIENHYEYQQAKDPKLLLGGEIDGVCISRESLDSYFIWDGELR